MADGDLASAAILGELEIATSAKPNVEKQQLSGYFNKQLEDGFYYLGYMSICSM